MVKRLGPWFPVAGTRVRVLPCPNFSDLGFKGNTSSFTGISVLLCICIANRTLRRVDD
jgi:hypothetical protein